ncbi:VOC family protein, partial [Kibdelosporangium lantanae]
MSEKTGVTAIDHVGIAVPDLDEAIAFYTETFGLVVTVQEVNEDQGVREAMLRAPGDDGSGTAIQL